MPPSRSRRIGDGVKRPALALGRGRHLPRGTERLSARCSGSAPSAAASLGGRPRWRWSGSGASPRARAPSRRGRGCRPASQAGAAHRLSSPPLRGQDADRCCSTPVCRALAADPENSGRRQVTFAETSSIASPEQRPALFQTRPEPRQGAASGITARVRSLQERPKSAGLDREGRLRLGERQRQLRAATLKASLGDRDSREGEGRSQSSSPRRHRSRQR
jgi:hypothetical protein